MNDRTIHKPEFKRAIAMICKWMMKSVLFPGILLVLAQIFITIKPSAAINATEYAGILLPSEVIEGWHRVAVNCYTFERMQLIGYDHPVDRYLSLKLFWPSEVSPYITVGKIRYFKCLNRTPETAKALMHIIRGGIGTSELVLEVFYAPVQRTNPINALIVRCDIYTETSDPGEYENIFLLKLFKIHTLDADEISVLSTTAEKTAGMVDIPVMISESTNFEKPVDRNKIKKLFDSGRSPETNAVKLYTKTVTQETHVTVPFAESTTPKVSLGMTLASFGIDEKHLKVNSVVYGKEKARRISLSKESRVKSGEPVLQNQNMNATTRGRIEPDKSNEKLLANEMSPSTSETSFVDEFTSERTEQTTNNFGPTFKMDSTILPNNQTTLTSSQTNRSIPKTHCDCSKNQSSSNGDKHGAQSTETILDVKSSETSEARSQDSQRSPSTDVVTLEDREDENRNSEERIEKSVTSPWYNLVINARPKGSRRKMGLAKITYR